jgi:hypothetical protein
MIWKEGVAAAVRVRGESRGKSWLLGYERENGGLDECLDERFVGGQGILGGWMDTHSSVSLL